MRCIRDPAQPTWTREDQCHPDDYNAMEYSETNYRTTYATDLVIMVNSCLCPYPENRPTLTRLSKEIQVISQSKAKTFKRRPTGEVSDIECA